MNNKIKKDNLIESISVKEILENPENDLSYLIEGMIHKKTINLISGQSGVGKSWFTQILAGSITKGEKFMSKFKCELGNVVILDRENDHTKLKDRFKKLRARYENIHYINLLSSNLNDKTVEQLKSFIRKKNIKVIIIDSLIRFNTGDENSSKDVNEFFMHLRNILENCEAIFIIHHLKKLSQDQKSNNDSARGSTDIIASVDTHFILEKYKDTELIILKNVKNRVQKPIKDISFTLILSKKEAYISYKGKSKSNQEFKKENTKKLIFDALDSFGECDFNTLTNYVSTGKGYSETNLRTLINNEIKLKNISKRKIGNKYLYYLPDNK